MKEFILSQIKSPLASRWMVGSAYLIMAYSFYSLFATYGQLSKFGTMAVCSTALSGEENGKMYIKGSVRDFVGARVSSATVTRSDFNSTQTTNSHDYNRSKPLLKVLDNFSDSTFSIYPHMMDRIEFNIDGKSEKYIVNPRHTIESEMAKHQKNFDNGLSWLNLGAFIVSLGLAVKTFVKGGPMSFNKECSVLVAGTALGILMYIAKSPSITNCYFNSAIKNQEITENRGARNY